MIHRENHSHLFEITINAFILLVGVCLLTGLVSVRSWYKPSIKNGQVSPVTVILDKDVEVTDKVKTDETKEKARLESIQNLGNREILEVDQEMFQKNLNKLNFLIKISREEILSHKAPSFPLNSKISLTTQEAVIDLSDDDFSYIKAEADNSEKDNKSISGLEELNLLTDVERKFFFDEVAKLREEKRKAKEEKDMLGKSFFETLKKMDSEQLFMKTFEIQKKLMDLGIVHGLPKQKVIQRIRILYPNLTQTELQLVQKLIERSTRPNIKIDWRKVEEIEKEAMEAVPNVITNLKSGYMLAKKGKRVDPQNYFYLKELNKLNPKPDWKHIVNNFLFLCVFVVVLVISLVVSKLKKYNTQEILMMLIVTLSVAAIIDLISIWGINNIAIAPLATISLLLTIFYAPTMAAVITTLMAYFLINSFDLNAWQVFPLYVGSIYAIFLVRKVHQREDLTNAGTKIALCQIIVFALTIMLAVEHFEVLSVLILASLYGASALISGLISLAALPYLESGLNLLTPFKLIELSNPDQPLLKKLKKEAPGTYQHSLNVLRFSEEACNAIGANTELIRVGLLYHDVGKTYKSDYFIENMLGKPNPHTTLDDPKKSAEIIIAHIPEGIKLAKKFNLPSAIADFIPMHQGKTVTNYFYHKAIEKFGKTNVNTADYQYPGPSPNSKETGIAMMADSIEAALTSMKDLTEEQKIKDIINGIINARLNEGELNNTRLTQSDLEKIGEAFLKVWRSLNHERVKYPEPEQSAAAAQKPPTIVTQP